MRFVPDWYILEKGGTLKSLSDCNKNQELCDKAIDNYSHALEFVLECYKTQEMCDKAFNKRNFVFDSAPDQFKTKTMRDKIISDDPFKLKYGHDRYQTQQICDEAVDDFLAALKFVHDWLLQIKWLKGFLLLYVKMKIYSILMRNPGDDVFFCNKMGILSIDLNNINLDDTNYDEGDPETIIHVRLLAW